MKMLTTILFVLSALAVFAQIENKSVSSPLNTSLSKELAIQLKVYAKAQQIGDLETATHALHHLILTHPDSIALMDTLAMIYLQRGYYIQARAVLTPLYDRQRTDFRTEILAACASKLQNLQDAVELYRRLYANTRKNVFAFEQLKLEYRLGRAAEARSTAEGLLKTIPKDDKTLLSVAKSDGKSSQNVLLKAFVLYTYANLLLESNDKEVLIKAKALLEEAISINVEYESASLLLKSIEENLK